MAKTIEFVDWYYSALDVQQSWPVQFKKNLDTQNDNNRAHYKLENIILGINVRTERMYEKKIALVLE